MNRLVVHFVALLAAFPLSAASAGTAQGVRGVATVGPTCPVERFPPDPACGPRAYRGTLAAYRVGGSRAIRVFSTDAHGAFRVGLAPGAYEIRSRDGGLPDCRSAPVNVAAGVWAGIEISCDTGMR